MQPYVVRSVAEVSDPLRLMATEVVPDVAIPLRFGQTGDNIGEKGYYYSLVWHAAVLPNTSPVAVLNAANKLSVPLRFTRSRDLSARPGDRGNIRS